MTEKTAITRTMEEITASARINMADMVNRAIALGRDLSDAKEQLGHGRFLPWLKELGLSSSTASNYMRVAREIAPGSRLAQLPYSKALALLSAPAEDREELAEEAESRSAAEIRKLVEERNRAAEAANAETARADKAEQDAKRYYDEIAALNTRISHLEAENAKAYNKGHVAGQKVAWDDIGVKEMANELDSLRKELDEKKAALLIAENNVVEVVPADYEELKKNREELLNAAAEAEERAAAAEAELEAAKAGNAGRSETWKILNAAVSRFMAECELLPTDPQALMSERARVETSVGWVEAWCRAMREALGGAMSGEGVVA